MADSKLTALTENTALLSTDLVYVIDDPGGSAASQKATVETLLKAILADGWIPAGETWVYASADDPTYTFTVAGVDLTTKYYAGMRLKLTQTTVKYFIITKVAFSTNTTVTVYGGTDYDLADAAITLPYYSTAKAPAGFPLDPTKWTVEVNDTSGTNVNTPTQNTWYNPDSRSISIPIGIWNVEYSCALYIYDNGTSLWINTTLSTANNTQSDADFTTSYVLDGASTASNLSIGSAASRKKTLVLTSKTPYYLNIKTSIANITLIKINGGEINTIIRAVCAYL